MDAALLEGGAFIWGSKTPFTLYFSLFLANLAVRQVRLRLPPPPRSQRFAARS